MDDSLQGRWDEILSTVMEMLVADEMYEAAQLLRDSDCSLDVTGYDNWNGGTDLYTLFVRVPAPEYTRIRLRKDAIETQVDERLKAVVGQISDDWFGAVANVVEFRGRRSLRALTQP